MGPPTTTLAVKDYREFQHYRDRTPLWIKLYNSLLDDYAFSQLSEVARAHLMLIWLLASRHDNKIPNDAKYIARAIHAKARIDLPGLIAGGWLIVEQVASKPLAEPEQSATSPRASGEGEGENTRENNKPSSGAPPISMVGPSDEAALAGRLATDADRLALTAICARVPSAVAWVAEAGGALEGMHGPQLTPKQLGEALRDYVGNGALAAPSLQHFRKYLRRAAQADTAPRTARTAAQRTRDNGLDALKDIA